MKAMPHTHEPITIASLNSRFGKLLDRRISQRRRRKARRGDLLAWFKHYLPHHFPLPFSSMHTKTAKRLLRMTEERGVKEGIVAPRGNSKTTTVSLGYALYCICEDLEQYIALIADSTSQAIERVDAIAYELENNPRLARDYEHACGRGPTWNKQEIVTRNGVKVVGLGTHKKFRGAKKRQHRPTLVLGDDLDDADSPYSPVKRSRNNDWVDRTLLNLGTTGHTNYWFNGTAIHRDCVVCRNPKRGIRMTTFASIVRWPARMDLWQRWEDIFLDPSEWDADVKGESARRFYEANEAQMNVGAEVLWPELETLYQLMEMRATMGYRAFESEKQGNPIDPGTCEWDPRHFEGDVWFDEWPDKPDVKVTALDPSKGAGDKPNCYQAIVDLAVKGGTIYLDADIGRRSVDEMCEVFVEHIAEFQPDAGVVEDAVFQELLLDMMDDIAEERGLVAPIEGISHEGVRKEVRIRRWGPFITRGQVKFKRHSPGAALLMEQFKDFPNGQFIDGPDAAEMALRKARRMLGGTTQSRGNPM